jgi:hypothetical protein
LFLSHTSLSLFSLSFISSSRTYEDSGGGAAADAAAPPPEKKKIPPFFKKKPFSKILFRLDPENQLSFFRKAQI